MNPSVFASKETFHAILFETLSCQSKSCLQCSVAGKFKSFFDNKPNQIPILGIRVQPDLQAIGFEQRNTLQCSIPATSPWLFSRPCVNFDLHRFIKTILPQTFTGACSMKYAPLTTTLITFTLTARKWVIELPLQLFAQTW